MLFKLNLYLNRLFSLIKSKVFIFIYIQKLSYNLNKSELLVHMIGVSV